MHPAADPPTAGPGSQPSDGDAREGRELIEAAARVADGREKLTADEQVDATEWFLSDTDDTDDTYSFQINVGTPTKKKWVEWTIQPVDQDELRRIRRNSQQGNRRARRAGGTGELDGDKANVEIVVRGTISPDLREAAKARGIVDPADAVRFRFKRKPGLIDQIAGEIMALSGYDDDDVREVDAARG